MTDRPALTPDPASPPRRNRGATTDPTAVSTVAGTLTDRSWALPEAAPPPNRKRAAKTTRPNAGAPADERTP